MSRECLVCCETIQTPAPNNPYLCIPCFHDVITMFPKPPEGKIYDIAYYCEYCLFIAGADVPEDIPEDISHEENLKVIEECASRAAALLKVHMYLKHPFKILDEE